MPEIIVDHRELKSETARKLFDRGIALSPKQLLAGDFVLSNGIVVERKLFSDFQASIMDGRLFRQAELLSQEERPLIAIVGPRDGSLSSRSIAGALSSLVFGYRIPIAFFSSEEDFAEFLEVTALAQEREGREMRLQNRRKSIPLEDQQRLIVESVSLVGPVQAKSLLAHFKSVRSIAVASEKELLQVEGIGKEKAKRIVRVFESPYSGVKGGEK